MRIMTGHKIQIRLIWWIIFLGACHHNQDKPSSHDVNSKEKTFEVQQKKDSDIIDVYVEINSDTKEGLIKFAENDLADNYFCSIDDAPEFPCSNHSKFDLPVDDKPHRVTVRQRDDEHNVIAIGDAIFYANALSNLSASSLVLRNSQSSEKPFVIKMRQLPTIGSKEFYNGITIKRSQDISFTFDVENKPGSCQVFFRCSLFKEDTLFDPLCNLANGITIPGSIRPYGINYLRVEATCGDLTSEPFYLHWVTVPDHYEVMAIDYIKISANKYLLHLMNEDDCPPNKLEFKCQDSNRNSVYSCAKDNIVVIGDSRQINITPVCNKKTYPDRRLQLP